jgi:hypothetical protein
MDVLEIPELTSEQIEELCLVAEKAARHRVLSEILSRKVETLDINADPEGTKPVKLKVDVTLTLSPTLKNLNVQKLADEAVKEAFSSVEKHLRHLACHSQI